MEGGSTEKFHLFKHYFRLITKYIKKDSSMEIIAKQEMRNIQVALEMQFIVTICYNEQIILSKT